MNDRERITFDGHLWPGAGTGMRLFEAQALADPEWAVQKSTKALKAMLHMWPNPTRLQRDLLKMVASVDELGGLLRESTELTAVQEEELRRLSAYLDTSL